jgi:hypothetical protein
MSLMSGERYADAATLLINSRHINWCRSHYLLACCFAQSAARDKHKTTFDQAWTHLTQAIGKNYLTYLHAKFGWPLDRCRMQVLEDSELTPLRARNEKKFRKIIGQGDATGGGSGGCFPASVAVYTPDGPKPIGRLRVGDVVTSVDANIRSLFGKVSAVRKTNSNLIFTLNGSLDTTPLQPVHTLAGWKTAEQLQVGDLLSSTRGPELLTSVVCRASSTVVYSLTVEPFHQFYAEGLLVHNKI